MDKKYEENIFRKYKKKRTDKRKVTDHFGIRSSTTDQRSNKQGRIKHIDSSDKSDTGNNTKSYNINNRNNYEKIKNINTADLIRQNNKSQKLNTIQSNSINTPTRSIQQTSTLNYTTSSKKKFLSKNSELNSIEDSNKSETSTITFSHYNMKQIQTNVSSLINLIFILISRYSRHVLDRNQVELLII